MIHSSTAYTAMNIQQQQPLVIFNFGFAIWGNEWLSSRLSYETGRLTVLWTMNGPSAEVQG